MRLRTYNLRRRRGPYSDALAKLRVWAEGADPTIVTVYPGIVEPRPITAGDVATFLRENPPEIDFDHGLLMTDEALAWLNSKDFGKRPEPRTDHDEFYKP